MCVPSVDPNIARFVFLTAVPLKVYGSWGRNDVPPGKKYRTFQTAVVYSSVGSSRPKVEALRFFEILVPFLQWT